MKPIDMPSLYQPPKIKSNEIIREDYGPYCVKNGIICFEKIDKEIGPLAVPLCNFDARITHEVIKDNGRDKELFFGIQATRNGLIKKVTIPNAEFPGMKWVIKNLGARFIVNAGSSNLDRLREAIQRLSAEAQQAHVFTHTGWRTHEGKNIYVHAGGAIGASNVNIELDQGLERYAFPSDIPQEKRQGAAKLLIDLLNVADHSVTFPLFACVHLAPFASLLGLNFILWLVGTTGSLKSTLAAIYLCLFGDFTYTTLPASWVDTENSLEKKLFSLKDSLAVIDEFAPSSTSEGDKDAARKAARIIRGVGNGQARDRLRADLSARPSFAPRCLTVATGEHLPSVHSLMARIFAVELSREMVDKEKLSAVQKNSSLLPHYMAGFIQESAENLEKIIKQSKEDFLEYRAVFQGSHPRVPEILSWLKIGFDLGMDGLLKAGIDKTILSPYKSESIDVIEILGKKQSQAIDGERPSIRFFEILKALIDRKKISLDPSDSNCVGWTDEEYIYLKPTPTINEAKKFSKEEGSYFNPTPNSLYKAIETDGFLVRSERESEKDRSTLLETMPGKSKPERVVRLRRAKVEDTVGEIVGRYGA